MDMIKSIIFLIALNVVVFANYETANRYYENGEYEKAIVEAKSSTSEYSNPNLHLVWAKSAEALGDTTQAMSAYERVTMLDSTNTQARVALVKIYKQTSRDELAKEMSKELQNYQLTPAQRSSLELLQAQDINSFKARGTLGIGYDSNINISANASDLDSYYGMVGNMGETSTLFARLNGALSYIYEFDEKGGLFFRSDLELYYQNNFDAHYFDMLAVGLNLGLGYSGDGYTFYMPVGYDKVNYLDVDLLNQIRVAPKFDIALTNDFILNVNAKYAQRSYHQARRGMDDSSFGAGVGLYYLFDDNYAFLNTKYETFSSSEANHYSYIDKDMITIKTGFNYNPIDWLTTKFNYRYRKGNYDDTDGGSKKRDDNYHQVELKLSHYLSDGLELFISESYVKNFSNFAPAKYSKNIAMFGISANY